MAGVKKGVTVYDRFAAGCKVMPSGCIEWQGWKNQFGYGCFYVDGRDELVHRWAFRIKNGPISPGINICHACDNPACVNVDHLFSGTQKENLQDASRKGRVNKLIKVRGEKHHHATATWDSVREVRRRFALGERQIDIARDVGMTTYHVWQIIHQVTWKEHHEIA